MFPGKGFNQTKVGETFSTSLTVTEAHLVIAAGLFGDFNPLHVDDAHATKSRLGGRVLHGPFTSALASRNWALAFRLRDLTAGPTRSPARRTHIARGTRIHRLHIGGRPADDARRISEVAACCSNVSLRCSRSRFRS
jgi:hypothetical protein